MSRISHAAAALFAVATLCAAVPAAQAMTLSAPAAMRLATDGPPMAEDVRYVCRDWCGIGGNRAGVIIVNIAGAVRAGDGEVPFTLIPTDFRYHSNGTRSILNSTTMPANM